MQTDYLEHLTQTVSFALKEDIGTGDITAHLIDETTAASATVITRMPAVIAGRPWVDEVFRQIDDKVTLDWLVEEGDLVSPDTHIFEASGSARSILTAERSALNFLQTISAVATKTRYYVELIRHTESKILDTRKTIPGLRMPQKYAVTVGGGMNHRIGLYDAFLIKENHIAAAGSISKAIASAKKLSPESRVEVEVETMQEYQEAQRAEPDWIMLDNFSIDELREAVASNKKNIKLEASGGIELETDLIALAETGVDYISIGALTKHCEAVDLSMRLES